LIFNSTKLEAGAGPDHVKVLYLVYFFMSMGRPFFRICDGAGFSFPEKKIEKSLKNLVVSKNNAYIYQKNANN